MMEKNKNAIYFLAVKSNIYLLYTNLNLICLLRIKAFTSYMVTQPYFKIQLIDFVSGCNVPEEKYRFLIPIMQYHYISNRKKRGFQ